MATTPPGFYDDGRGSTRWWDGTKWTHDVKSNDAEDLAGRVRTRTKTDADATAGAFVATAVPKKSRPWILWAALGAVILSIIIAAAVVIPIILANASDGRDESVAAVEMYDEAWRTTDCEMFTEATTEGFRSRAELVDCAAFDAASASFIATLQDYEVTVVNAEQVGDQVNVFTSETYSSALDVDGNVLDPPVEYEDRLRYVVVPFGEGWAINEVLDDVPTTTE